MKMINLTNSFTINR